MADVSVCEIIDPVSLAEICAKSIQLFIDSSPMFSDV